MVELKSNGMLMMRLLDLHFDPVILMQEWGYRVSQWFPMVPNGFPMVPIVDGVNMFQ